MPWVRIFKSRKQAEAAKEILEGGGIESSIAEYDIDGVLIVGQSGIPTKFQLNVSTSEEYYKAAKYLASLLKEK